MLNGSKNNKNNKEEINLSTIKEFLKSLENTDIEEFEWTKGEFHLKFVRELDEKNLKNNRKIGTKNSKGSEEKTIPFHVIKSLGIGICHLKNDKGEDFIKENENVRKGKILCKIESMKVLREIKSPVSGKLIKILIKDKERVDYGRELFYIE